MLQVCKAAALSGWALLWLVGRPELLPQLGLLLACLIAAGVSFWVATVFAVGYGMSNPPTTGDALLAATVVIPTTLLFVGLLIAPFAILPNMLGPSGAVTFVLVLVWVFYLVKEFWQPDHADLGP